MITSTIPNPDRQRIWGHKLGFSQLEQNPVSSLMFLSYQPDLTGMTGAPIAAVVVEIGGARYDQVDVLELIESYSHNRIALSREILKAHGYRPFADIWADIETLRWFNTDQQYTYLAEQWQQELGWSSYPGTRGVNRYQLKNSPSRLAEATAWQATVLDQAEAMRDSEGQPILGYSDRLQNNRTIMDKFSLRGKSTAVDALAGAVYAMLSIAPDLRWQYLNR